MRNLICAIAVVGFIAGCTESNDVELDEMESVTAIETERAAPSDEASDELASESGDEPSSAPSDEFGLGDPAPKFEGIVGVDDKKHSFDDYADAKALAVVFTCNSCPVAVAYEDRLIAVQKDYADKGVQLVAINVNNVEPDKLPAMKDRAEEKGFQFPYLYDPTQQVARDYGAKVTPHIFLLDGNRRLAYVGPVDDNVDGANASKPFLRDAIDAVLAEKTPETTEVEPVGCGIKYE
jgi:peroxiredoxin